MLFIDATAAKGTLGPNNSKGSSRVSYGKYCKVLQVLFLAALCAPVPSLPGAVGLKSRPFFFHCGGFPSFPTASAWCGATRCEAQRDPVLEPSCLPASAFPTPHKLRTIGNCGVAPIPLLLQSTHLQGSRASLPSIMYICPASSKLLLEHLLTFPSGT